jgi:hypothetical protein
MAPDPSNPSAADELEQLKRRLDLLEDENQRLKAKMEPLFGPDNPSFDPIKFQRALAKPMLLVMLPIMLLAPLLVLGISLGRRVIPPMDVLGFPLIDFAGIGTRHPGVGIGVIGVGGAGIGVIGIGGLGVGIIALGGGSIGLLAVGGGSLGLIAVGGGACGYIAIGGGACGYYALGQRAQGKYVLALNRQDDEAIEFFCRFFPGLRAAVTRPMPVIPVQR